MGSQWVDDPFYGNLANNLASSLQAAPGKALDNISKVEEIKWNRKLRAAAEGASAAFPGAVPPAAVPPTNLTVNGPYVGDPNAPVGSIEGIPLANAPYTDPRALALAEGRRKLAVSGGSAAVLKDPSTWAPQSGYAEVAAGGVPSSAADRARVQFMTTGRFPTTEETKTPNAQNFAVVNADGTETGQGFASLNGGRTALDGTPIQLQPGQRIMETGPVGLKRPNPIESEPIAQNNFNELAARLKAKADAGQPISDAELNAARQMKAAGWKEKIEYKEDGATGRIMPLITPAIPPTGGHAGWLFGVLNDIDGAARPPAAITPSPAPPPPPGGGGGATVTDPAAVPPAPAAAPPAPGPQIRAMPLVGTGNPAPVVAEYMRQPVITSIENAKNGYSSLVANMPFNTGQSDLAIIVGAAKILDPPSVVREGEVENVKKTGGIMDQFIGMLDKAQGGAGLTTQVRAQLWQMVNAKLQADIENVKPLREQHAVQLRQRNVNPDDYLPALPQITPIDTRIINSQNIQTGNATAPAATTPPPPRRGADAVLGR